MKKRIIIGLLALSVILVMAAAAWATSGTVPINVTYRDIKIVTNGNTVTADPTLGEPFIYNGRTYLPIRMAAQALGLTIDWVDWANMVTISGSTSSTELEALRTENAALRDKITRLEEGGGDLSDLESTLIDGYDTLGDVEIDDITLDGDEDDVDVTIDVDLADFDSEWDDLSNSDIENFIDDIVSDIQDEYSEDTVVTGEIVDIDSGDTLVEFDKDGTDDLNVDIGGSSTDLSDLESTLSDDYDYLGDVRIDDLALDGDEDDVDVTIEVDLASYDREYADLSNSDIENFIDDIVSDIQNEYTEDTVVTGVITDIDSGDDLVDFSKDGTDDLDVNFSDSTYR
jgi:DNA-binding ferritin-like protein (Dps family)